MFCPAGVKEVFPELTLAKCCLELRLFGPKFLPPRFALRTLFRNSERKKEFWKLFFARRRPMILAEDEEGCLLNYRETLHGLHFRSRAEKQSPKRMRAGELRNLLVVSLPLFWSFSSWRSAQMLLGVKVWLWADSHQGVWASVRSRQKEFKKTPLLWATRCALRKLLTELYSICSA